MWQRYKAVFKPLFIFILFLAMWGCATSTTNRVTSKKRPVPTKHPRPIVSGNASRRCRALLPYIEQAAKKGGIETALLVGIVRVESNFNPTIKSRVGAIGLTQVMPSTGRYHKCGDLFDPLENLACGVKVLNGFLKYYNNNLVLALSGYNAGHYAPDNAARSAHVPKNFKYVEAVLHARAHFLLYGCRW